ncbi:ABC transporter permease [Bacillus sp. EB600]|uniref:ABC transporter permease n=1 Tax=Bacillus sp. EB600 TaxID=2806345 RepID=UPI0035C23C80
MLKIVDKIFHSLVSTIFYGSIFGTAGAIIIYFIKKYVVRLELLDVAEKGLLFLLIGLCLIWVISNYRNQLNKYGKAVLFSFSFVFALVQSELIILASIPQFSMANGINTEWIGKMALTALAVLLLFFMALGMNRLGLKMNRKFVFILFISQSLILLAKELTELLQMLFSLQILPLTMWALEVLAPLVNHKDYFFYIIAITIVSFLFVSSISIYRFIKEKKVTFANPAEKRKLFAQSVRTRRWLYSFAAIQMIFFSFLAGAKVIQAKAVTSNPPVEVTSRDGHIHIHDDMLKEKGLNVFSYRFPDHTEARFIVAGKSVKKIFWANNILNFVPYLEATGKISSKQKSVRLIGTWFNKRIQQNGNNASAVGLSTMKSWWKMNGKWPEEGNDSKEIVVGKQLATELNLEQGNNIEVETHSLKGPKKVSFKIVGIIDADGVEDESIFVPLNTMQTALELPGKIRRAEVSALTVPENELAKKAGDNPSYLSEKEYETWYCTVYASAIAYQIEEVIKGSEAKPIRQIAQSEGVILNKIKGMMFIISVEQPFVLP